MKKIFVKPLNYLIEFDSSIKSLKLNSPSNYKEISFNLEESIILSIDNEERTLCSTALVIKNPFEIDLNEKRLLNSIYRKIQMKFTDKQLEYIQKIEEDSFTFLDDLLEDTDYHLEYSESIDIMKLFSCFNLSFPIIEYENYLELLSTYCKLHAEYNKVQFVISFGALNLLNESERWLLEKELEINNLVMLDISFNSANVSKNDLIIDNDWCII